MSHQYFGITALALIGVLWGAPGCDGLQDDGDGTRQTNIQFGKATQKWPQVGELLSNHRCTGTLIAPNAVLTAAHCISSAATMFHVDKDGARTSYNITTQVGHPSYSGATCPTSADIAVMRLAEPIPGSFLQPMGIDRAPEQGDRCTAVGYGRHNDGVFTVVSGTKREAMVWVDEVTDNSVNVKFGDGITDAGDSGGPLLHEGRVAGVVSCGLWTAGETQYTRADVFSDWVDEVVRSFQN